MRRSSPTAAFAAAALLLCQTATRDAASAGDWPGFRGPAANGVVPGPPLPVAWDGETGANVRWSVPIAGEGWSQPVIVGDRLFLTAAVQQSPPAAGAGPANRRRGRYRGPDLTSSVYRYELRCLDANDGAEIWTRIVKTGAPALPRHRTNTYATETPVTDGERVYALFGMTVLAAYTLEGEPVWSQDLRALDMRAGWGTAASPALHGGRLFLQVDNQEGSFLRALDAASGDELWRVERDEPSSYGSPIIWEHGGTAELVAGGQVYRGHDPATGEELWRLDMALGRHSATPAAFGSSLLIGTEYRDRGGSDDGGGYIAAIAAGARGDLGTLGADAADGVLWATERGGLQMASPAVAGGRVYLFERRGAIAHVLDLQTGEKLLRTRLPAGAPVWASPLVSGGKVYVLDENGVTHVLDAGGEAGELNVIARNELPGGPFWASPAAADGRLYVRGSERLWCLAEGGVTGAATVRERLFSHESCSRQPDASARERPAQPGASSGQSPRGCAAVLADASGWCGGGVRADGDAP